MSKYSRKKVSPVQDEFLSFWQQLFQKAVPYARAIGILLGTTLLAVVVGGAVSNWLDGRAGELSEAFGRAVRIAEADLLTEDAKKDETKPVPAKEENEIPRFKSEKDRSEAVLAALDELEKKHGKRLGDSVMLFRAGVLCDLGRYEDAQKIYQGISRKKQRTTVEAIATEGLGLAAEARDKLDEALAAFQQLENTGGDFYKDRAIYHQGRIHQKKGDKKKAAELFQEVIKKVPTTQLKDEIQARMVVLGGA